MSTLSRAYIRPFYSVYPHASAHERKPCRNSCDVSVARFVSFLHFLLVLFPMLHFGIHSHGEFYWLQPKKLESEYNSGLVTTDR